MITVSTSKVRLERTYHHGDLRDALIDAALVMLQEGGDPAALSLREAARRAGVSAMAPYRHFADKDALLAAVAIVGFGRLADALRAADAAPHGNDALVGQGVAYVDFACAHPALFRLMFGSALAGRHGDLAIAAEQTYAVMATRVAAIFGAGDRETDAWALRCWATAHGLAALAVDGQLSDRGEPPTSIAAKVLRLIGSLPGA